MWSVKESERAGARRRSSGEASCSFSGDRPFNVEILTLSSARSAALREQYEPAFVTDEVVVRRERELSAVHEP